VYNTPSITFFLSMFMIFFYENVLPLLAAIQYTIILITISYTTYCNPSASPFVLYTRVSPSVSRILPVGRMNNQISRVPGISCDYNTGVLPTNVHHVPTYTRYETRNTRIDVTGHSRARTQLIILYIHKRYCARVCNIVSCSRELPFGYF